MERRGFTLVELLIGTAIGSLITLAAVGFVAHQTRALGATSELLEISESTRFGLDRITSDLRMAGVGVGYTEAGAFAGLANGTFRVGEATFTSDNRVLSRTNKPTDDLGILVALGGRTTISRYDEAGVAEVCRGSTFRAGELVVFGTEDGLTGRSARITSIGPTTCMGDDCVSGCDALMFSDDDTYLAGSSARSAYYAGGTASGDLNWITWFIEDGDGVPHLRRAVGPCVALDANCGEVVADYVESLQIRRWENIDGAWTDVTASTAPIGIEGRLRVDVEMIVRSRFADGGPSEIVRSALERDLCFPACSGASDGYVRRRVATSIEIKNSGRGRYRRDP